MKDSYKGRGLHSPKWEIELCKGGKLYDLLKIVKSDEDLVIEIRNDYFNIYYKGGNMARVASANSFQFDSNYYKGYQRPDYESKEQEDARKALRKDLLKRLKETRDYNGFVRFMKCLMN